MASPAATLLTFAEFEQLPDPALGHYELHHGELITMPPRRHGHEKAAYNLRELLAEAAGRTFVVREELGFQIGDREYRVADVALLPRARFFAVPDEGYLDGPPDLTVEVLSPSNTAGEMFDKEQICLENGAVQFWVVDPVRSQVKVTTRDGRTKTYKSGEEIPLFFGGFIPVDGIFANA